jgi:hypothetical protein
MNDSGRMPAILSLTLAAGIVALALWFGGVHAVLYLGLYALALAPGLPIGWWLFGRRQPVGWIAGALVGYGLTALAFWLPIRLDAARSLEFALAWIAVTAIVWWPLGRVRTPLIELPGFTRRDRVIWLLLLHLVVAVVALPFGRLGERDATGTRCYRAYFTADFVWHTALTQELARFDWPPRNPFFARDPVHYYYTYFLVPAVLSGPVRAPLVSVETALKVTAVCTALLMFSLVFFAAWSAAGRAGPAAAASVVALVAPSFEGTYKVIDLLARGAPLGGLRDLNIDAVTAWDFHGLRVDGLVRSMWYTPQHSTSFALGLIGVLVASRLTARTRPATFLLTGIALGLSVLMSPLLGAAFCIIYGLTIAVDALTRRLPLSAIALQALTVVPVALGLMWYLANGMGEGAGAHLSFGWLYDARNHPVLTLVLSLGGLLIPALAGLWRWPGVPFRPALPAVIGLIVGLGLLYLVSLTDRSWVGFRAGNILQVLLPMLVARGLTGLVDSGRLRLATVGVAAILAAGAPTTLIDTYNAQDITNVKMGPGFPWTIRLSPEQQAGLDWIRRATPPRSVVQADPFARDRSNWSIIPTFAGRRMAVGQALPLLPELQHAGAPDRAHAILGALPLDQAHDQARKLGIDYLWMDEDDAAAHLGGVPDRFQGRPDLFTQVFRQGAVVVYRVE